MCRGDMPLTPKHGCMWSLHTIKLHIILCQHMLTHLLCLQCPFTKSKTILMGPQWWCGVPWILVYMSSACTNWYNFSLLCADSAAIFSIKLCEIQQLCFCRQIIGYTEDHCSTLFQPLAGTNRNFDAWTTAVTIIIWPNKPIWLPGDLWSIATRLWGQSPRTRVVVVKCKPHRYIPRIM